MSFLRDPRVAVPVLVALVALPSRGWWGVIAPLAVAWAVVSVFRSDAGRPVVVLGGNLAVFGTFLLLGVLVLVAVVAKEAGWIRAVGWFELLFLLPILVGVAGCWPSPPATRATRRRRRLSDRR